MNVSETKADPNVVLTNASNDSDMRLQEEEKNNNNKDTMNVAAGKCRSPLPVCSKHSQYLLSDSGVQVNITPCQDMSQEAMMKDAQTQKDESDSSAEQITIIETQDRRRQSVPRGLDGGVCKRKTHRRFISKSKSPSRRNPYQTRVEPAISPDVDVYGILANVARTEGPFLCPEEALKAAIAAFTQDVWCVSSSDL